MIFIGVDPGFSGAVATILEDGTLEVEDMPTLKNVKGKVEIDLHGLYSVLHPEGFECFAVVEQVGAMPGQGVTSMFRFGQSYGAIQMAVAAHKIPVAYVTPVRWKKHFGLTRGKDVSRGLAMQRFPDRADWFKRVKDDGRAEAALLALYAKEVMP